MKLFFKAEFFGFGANCMMPRESTTVFSVVPLIRVLPLLWRVITEVTAGQVVG